MRVFIRHITSGQYYDIEGKRWVPKNDGAYDFGSISSALNYLADRRLLNGEVVLLLNNPEQAIVIKSGPASVPH